MNWVRMRWMGYGGKRHRGTIYNVMFEEVVRPHWLFFWKKVVVCYLVRNKQFRLRYKDKEDLSRDWQPVKTR